MRRIALFVAAAMVVLSGAAWNAVGHRTVTESALNLLPADAPAWLRQPDIRAQIAFQSNEPDRWRGVKLAALSHENGPDHFLDLELLGKSGLSLQTMPQLRYEFVAQLARAESSSAGAAAPPAAPARGVSQFVKDEVGFLPYAILEHQTKLVASFNTLRILEQLNEPARRGQLEAARANVIHEMGQLSHFVGDAGQPLHATIHHHGWVGENPDGFTTERSFHQYIDGDVLALHGLNSKSVAELAKPLRPIKPETVWDETLALIARSYAAVRPLYELQKSGALQQPPGRAFINERLADAASVLAGLYWEAWLDSAPTEQQVRDFVRYDAAGAEDAPATSPTASTLPRSVDLRNDLVAMGLPPRSQGPRGTCSVFTTCEAIEFALAKQRGHATRLSAEFLNWAASQAAGARSDGNFFHNALAGFDRFGICAEVAMPYQAKYDAAHVPSAEALAEAKLVREESHPALAVRWIVPWQTARFGVNDAQFAEIKAVLARGFPVAAGSGHSRLLVGFRDDASLPGGGAFLTEDSALARFDEVSYEFVRKQVADVFWVEAKAPSSASTEPPAQAPPPPAPAPAASSTDLGFEAGEHGKTPREWFVPVHGWKAELTEADGAAGKLCVRLSPTGESSASFGNLMRFLEGHEYQGQHIKLSARVRVDGQAGTGARMWLRADRAGNTPGAFDNMGDHPIMAGGWTNAVIESDIDADALRVAIGFMAFGGATLYVDSVMIETGAAAERKPASPPSALTPRATANLEAATRLLSYVRFFHPSDQAVAVQAWDNFAAHVLDEAEAAADAADLAARLQQSVAPIAPTVSVWAGGPESAPPPPPPPSGANALVHWRHLGAGSVSAKRLGQIYASTPVREGLADAPQANDHAVPFVVKSLGGGVSCRIPVKIYADDEGTLPHAAAASPWAKLDGQPKLSALDRSTRLAGVALCWGVMQHFYPYFDVVATDWDAALTAALTKAAQDSDETQYLDTLRELIAKLHDGHGNVFNPATMPTSMLPLAFAWAGPELVVAGKDSSAPGEVRVGDAVISIGGKTVAECCKDLSTRISAATEGWKRTMLLQAIASSLRTADACSMELRHPDGTEFSVTLRRIGPTIVPDATAHRPANGTELAPGIVYFNLSGADVPALAAAMPALERAKRIVFDLRGYPDSAAVQVLQHLITKPATSAWWNVPIITLPDRERWEWQSSHWDLQPLAPHLDAKIAFITDGRAISYAESIMGIVEAYKIGAIVGQATAGTNGNVNPIALPGGYRVAWTGMKVTKHDGSQHHGVGIQPTVPVDPTPQGIAEGRDELLEKAVEALR